MLNTRMAVTKWQDIVRQCFYRRLFASDFVKIVQQERDVNSKAISKILLDCRQSFCPPRDPLPPRYLEALLVAGLVSPSDLLTVLIAQWNGTKKAPSAELASLEELTLLTMSPKLVLDLSETSTCLLLSAKWLTAIVHFINRDPSNVESSITQLSETCGNYLTTLAGTSNGIAALSEKKDKKENETSNILSSVNEALELTIGLFPTISAQLMDRLGVVQKHIAMVSQETSNGAQQGDMQALHFQASVAETKLVASRAGTTIYLESLLFAGKTVDDAILFGFLEGRHNNDYSAMFQDILLASFQVLKKASGLSAPFLNQSQCYIRNKLPSILASIASAPFATFTAEQALVEHWTTVKTELGNPDLANVAHRFLHVCSLAQLISHETAIQLIDEPNATTGFSQSLQSKDDVVAEVNNGHMRLTHLVDQLIQTDGSAAAIAQAIVEIILTYCQSKETHHLKDLANAMIRSADAISALALFIRPSYWLSPLAALLDQWSWDDIHGESQPLYDEFGSILLLLLASKRRLRLATSDIGTSSNGFVARYLESEGTERALQDLSEESKNHIGEWINALYIAEGLSDDVTTSCSPQEFYILLPTLLRQSWMAVQAGKLSQSQLEGGLQYLLEPFLLPSLVTALEWLRSVEDKSAKAKFLATLSKSPESREARGIHQTILDMTDPTSQFAFHQRPTGDAKSFKETAKAVIISKDTSAILPSVAQSLIRVHGLDTALGTMLRALLHFAKKAHFLEALDGLATLVCVTDRQVRDLLRLKYVTLGSLLKANKTSLAEVIVHLHRRVEAYASVLIVNDIPMDQFTTLQLSNIDAVAANMEIPPQASQEMSVDVAGMPVEMSGDQQMDDIDQVLNESAVMGGLDQVDTSGLNMDDFYGLDDSGMGNLDDLDLEMFS